MIEPSPPRDHARDLPQLLLSAVVAAFLFSLLGLLGGCADQWADGSADAFWGRYPAGSGYYDPSYGAYPLYLGTGLLNQPTYVPPPPLITTCSPIGTNFVSCTTF